MQIHLDDTSFEMYHEEDLPIRVTGKLFSPSEQNIVKGVIVEELDVSIKFDDVSDLLGLHAIKKTFQNDTEISETKSTPDKSDSIGQDQLFQRTRANLCIDTSGTVEETAAAVRKHWKEEMHENGCREVAP